MEKNEPNNAEKMKQKIQLVKGTFSPNEASEIMMSLIEKKINFHKIQKLQLREKNHKFNTDDIDSRIRQLRKEKEVAKAVIALTTDKNVKLKIDGVLEITILENNETNDTNDTK